MASATVSRPISGKKLPWSRFWVPLGGKISMGFDGQGFLEISDHAIARSLNGDIRPIDVLLSRPCLVLSGQPGIGKTFEVEALKDRAADWLEPGEHLVHFHCRSLVSEESLRRETVDSPRWKAVLSTGGRIRLLMDGVDEALRRVSVLIPALTRWLANEPCERIRVIIVCRAAEWHETDSEALTALWPGNEEPTVYELCPLRWKDAALAAEQCGVDSEILWREVCRLNVKSLAARPLTLRLLLEEMKNGAGLPVGHHQLFQRAIARICAEHDEDRLRHLTRPPDNQIRRTASRIAALLLLGGRSVVTRRQAGTGPDELPLAEIMAGHEIVDGETFAVTRELIQATLDTSLFSFRGPDQYGFDQAAFGEHLAADYLGSCTPSQLRRLLCVRLDGREIVAPQLAEVAAWVAVGNAEWRDALITSEPEILLRADIAHLDEPTKGRAVAALLARVEREEAFDSSGTDRFYASLGHPGLADQLRKYIHDTAHNDVVRRMAFEIAGVARVAELEAELWARVAAKDPCLRFICDALSELAGPQSTENLTRALRGEFPDNGRLELRGMAIRQLVPKSMRVREVLTFLIPQPDERIGGGSYQMAVHYELPEHLTVDDLPEVLRHVEHGDIALGDFRWGSDLTARAIELSLENLSRDEVLSALGRFWRARSRRHASLPSQYKHERDVLSALSNLEVRRKLAHFVLTLPEARPNDVQCGDTALVRGEDVEWLLQMLPVIPAEYRGCWANVCVWHVWGELTKDATDLLLARYVDTPEFRDRLPAARRFDIATTLTRHRRANDLRLQRRRKRHERRRLSRAKCMNDVWNAISENVSSAWVGFCRCADIQDVTDAASDRSRKDNLDITQTAAWVELDSNQQQILRAAARKFLVTFRDDSRAIHQWSNYAEAAAVAIYLFRTEISTDAELRTAVTQRWPAIVFDCIDLGDAGLPGLVGTMFRLAPKTARARVARRLRHANRQDVFFADLERYRECWDASLSEVIRSFLRSRGLKPASLHGAFHELFRFDRDSALAAFDDALAHRGGTFRPLDKTGRALLSVGLFMLVESRWGISWVALQRCGARVARSLLLEASHRLHRKTAEFAAALSTKQLIDLCELVWRLFPSDEYRDRFSADGSVSARHLIVDLRETLTTTLVGKAEVEACAGLKRIAAGMPPSQRIWMMWRHREALKNVLRVSWTAHRRTSAEMLAMTKDHRLQTVENADDLLEAVTASLERLQHRLHICESSELRALWNDPGKKSVPTPKTEAVLSDMVADWLNRDLGTQSGIVLNREVRATKLGMLDIKVQATCGGKPAHVPTVVVEVKGEWNRGINSALGGQLVKQYLQANSWSHGVYLVGWFGGVKLTRWRPPNLETASSDAFIWAAEQTPTDLVVRAIVLDCSAGGGRSA